MDGRASALTKVWQSMPLLRAEIAERIENLSPGINASKRFKERTNRARKLKDIREEQGRPRLFQLGELQKQEVSFFGAGTVGTVYNLPVETVYPINSDWHGAIDDDLDRIRQDLIDNPVSLDGVKGRWVQIDATPTREPSGSDPWQVVTLQIYCLMGVNVELAGLTLAADTGLLVVSGEAAGVVAEQTYALDAETGDLVASGEASGVVNTSLDAETGDLVASGEAACVVGVTLDAETGDLVLAGDCDLIVGYTLAADSGDLVAVAGEAVGVVNTSLDAETGAIVAVAGEAVGNIGLNIAADSGDLVAVAGEATAVIDTPLDAETGDIVASGTMSSGIGMTTTTGDIVASGEMTGVYSGDSTSLDAETGDLVASGEAVGVINTSLSADTGSIVAVAGSMAAGIGITTVVGDAVVSGSAVGNIGTNLDAETGDAVAAAGELTGVIGHHLAADSGDIVISGEATGEAGSAEAWPENAIACDPDLTTGSEDGSSWEDAYQSIQDAIDACSGTPVNILVKARTETLGVALDLDQVCTIYGGFANSLTGTSGSVEGRTSTVRTTIDGSDTYQIGVYTANVDFDGFVFQDGVASSGGAFYSYEYDSTFTNCIFDGNTASSSHGGALYFYNNTDLTLVDCEFTDNTASDDGGAITIRATSTLVATDCVFGNDATDENTAGIGGAIYATNASNMTLLRCGFNHNRTIGGSNDGGAVYTDGGTHTATDCTFSNNFADDDGGAAFITGGSTYTFNTCLFADNEADDDGGAIECYSGSTLNVNNCTFAGNDANDGSAIKTGGTITVINSCFYDNVNDDPISSTSATITYSNVEGGFTGTGNIDSDPHFRGEGSHPYQPDEDGDMVDGASNGDMTDNDILGDSWADDTMGCYNLDDS